MTAARAPERAHVQLQPDRRRAALAAGVGMIVLAAAAAALPAETALLIGAVAGWLLWLAGALMLVAALVMFNGWLRRLGFGAALLAIGVGVYLLTYPTVGPVARALLIAAALVMDGGFQLCVALHLRPLRAWRWLLASAVTSLIGAVVLATGLPAETPGVVAALLAAAFLTTGAALITIGVARPAHG